jgi:DNA-binding NarL/FixJ family response regulator
MQQKRIRIAVVDDHRVFAEALAARLSAEPDLEVVGTASTSAEVLDLLSHNEIDVVTLDLSLDGEDGLAVGRRLRDRWPSLRIVVVTAAADDRRVSEAVQMGVLGWVAKQGSIEALLIAVRGAARGETHLSAALLTRVLVSLSRAGKSSTPEADAITLLTVRELDVLRCLMEGLSRNEIGAKLRISPNTVRTHIQSILRKLNVHSALTAVAFARRAGIASVRPRRNDSAE